MTVEYRLHGSECIRLATSVFVRHAHACSGMLGIGGRQALLFASQV